MNDTSWYGLSKAIVFHSTHFNTYILNMMHNVNHMYKGNCGANGIKLEIAMKISWALRLANGFPSLSFLLSFFRLVLHTPPQRGNYQALERERKLVFPSFLASLSSLLSFFFEANSSCVLARSVHDLKKEQTAVLFKRQNKWRSFNGSVRTTLVFLRFGQFFSYTIPSLTLLHILSLQVLPSLPVTVNWDDSCSHQLVSSFHDTPLLAISASPFKEEPSCFSVDPSATTTTTV